MRKIFEQYGGGIVVTIAIVALIGIVCLLVSGTKGGWVGNAYHEVVDKFVKKVSFSASNDSEGDNGATSGSIALPSKMYAFVGQPIKLYYLNIIGYNNLDDITVQINAEGKGTSYSDRWEYTPTKAETFALDVFVYDKITNELLSKETFEIKVDEETEKESLSVLFIGDSTINQHTETQTVLDLAHADGYPITLLGTRGTTGSLNQHEGRGGWTAQMYCVKESAASGRVVNPFYNPSIEGDNKFDFEYYMTTQGYEDVDCVVFQLGINDVFSSIIDIGLNRKIETYLSYIDYMINDIRSYAPDIKIVLNLIIPCSPDENKFKEQYGIKQTAARNKRNTYLANLAMIEKYSNAENVYISHSNSSLDTLNNMADGGSGAVHPAPTGYIEIGTQVYSFLRAIN